MWREILFQGSRRTANVAPFASPATNLQTCKLREAEVTADVQRNQKLAYVPT